MRTLNISRALSYGWKLQQLTRSIATISELKSTLGVTLSSNRHSINSKPCIGLVTNIPQNIMSMSMSTSSSSSTTGSVVAGTVPTTKLTTTTTAARTALDETSTETGEFKRRDAAWRNWITAAKTTNDDNTNDVERTVFPAEPGRYHLYVAYACPWAHRTLLTRALKGLEDVISVTYVHPVWQRTRPNDTNDLHTGWVLGQSDSTVTYTNTDGHGGPFPSSYSNNEPDPFNPDTVKSIRDIYENCNDTDGKYTVPILYDTKKQTIVSNESADIIRMLNSEFNAYAKFPDLDLYPEQLRDEINSINDWIYPSINNGVYRCGFATTQQAYDTAIDQLTTAFDRVTSILDKQRYLLGNKLTEADVRLFVTLIRFDEVYTVYFKTNTRFVWNTPSLLNYCRDIYQTSLQVSSTVCMEQIKAHYYTSHPKLNYYSIIPKGNPNYIDLLQQPHNRYTM